jgi:hypothetical protein
VERTTAYLELAIEVNSDPISGSISNGLHRVQRFNGWMELVAAIEAARSTDGGVVTAGEPGVQTLGSLPGANAAGL